jgi:hypothetical protein
MLAADDENSFWYLSQGEINSLRYAGGSPKVWVIPAELDIDFHQEKLQVFTEAWRIFLDCWPEKDFNGLDWREVYDRHLPYARGAQTYEDLSVIIEVMMGELNASHLRSDYSSGQGEPTADLGLVFDQAELEKTGAHKVKAVLRGGPMEGEHVGSIVGLYLLEIHDVELGEGVNINSLLAGRAGKQLTLSLADSPKGDGTREVIVEPVSGSDARNLSYDRPSGKEALGPQRLPRSVLSPAQSRGGQQLHVPPHHRAAEQPHHQRRRDLPRDLQSPGVGENRRHSFDGLELVDHQQVPAQRRLASPPLDRG